MEPLSNLIGSEIVPEGMRVNRPSARVLDAALPTSETATQPAAYETSVFNFLFAHKDRLGINEVSKLGSSRMDGHLVLVDGQRLAVEIKYRMGWLKACQAEAQFRWFLKHCTTGAPPVNGGLVFFQEFTLDWADSPASRLLENGWNWWYSEHAEVEGLPFHLVRFRNERLETFTEALAAARAASASTKA